MSLWCPSADRRLICCTWQARLAVLHDPAYQERRGREQRAAAVEQRLGALTARQAQLVLGGAAQPAEADALVVEAAARAGGAHARGEEGAAAEVVAVEGAAVEGSVECSVEEGGSALHMTLCYKGRSEAASVPRSAPLASLFDSAAAAFDLPAGAAMCARKQTHQLPPPCALRLATCVLHEAHTPTFITRTPHITRSSRDALIAAFAPRCLCTDRFTIKLILKGKTLQPHDSAQAALAPVLPAALSASSAPKLMVMASAIEAVADVQKRVADPSVASFAAEHGSRKARVPTSKGVRPR